jgi:hypothetical protein
MAEQRFVNLGHGGGPIFVHVEDGRDYPASRHKCVHYEGDSEGCPDGHYIPWHNTFRSGYGYLHCYPGSFSSNRAFSA